MSRILVVDDSDLIRQLLQEGLAAAGFEVTIATDANHGFHTALQMKPDLILLDVQLPDATGFELCRVIRNRPELRHIPVIMITGTAYSTSEKVKGFQLGADDYVQKPFELSELTERISAVLRRKNAPAPAPAAEHTNGAPARPAPFVAPSEAPEKPALSIAAAARLALTAPGLLAGHRLPAVALPYLGCANLLALLGLMAAAGGSLKPLAAVLLVSGSWGAATSVFVIASSIIGIPIGWQEGSRIFALAALPFLLRLLGGVVFAFFTTLSPFSFSSGPALFSHSPAGWMEGFDVSCLWTVLIAAKLLSGRDPRHSRKAWGVAAILWFVFALAGFIGRRFG